MTQWYLSWCEFKSVHFPHLTSWLNGFNCFYHCRYCTEILALLPFTFPDEPLYLIHAINRIIQVRGGALQEEIKALGMHLLQRNTHTQNIPYENGMIPPQQAALFSDKMILSDMNGTVELDQSRPFCDFASMDLNQQVPPESVAHHEFSNNSTLEGKFHNLCSDLYSISKDDLHKIQVTPNTWFNL